ncbi:MAG TPA: [FeFe] hydrogenase H-cluster radical SAM maturase HydE, partial [Lentisphaeria bacterium]|nr:[FeFe] hydrogenase H-cluster radical SAM maturase HydE [Lentisphaeria bacterium]
MTDAELKHFLDLTDPEEQAELFRSAYEMKLRYIGPRVSLRGLVEISNICRKNCFYCGIRAGNANLKRYRISKEEIVSSALWAYDHHYGSVVLQSGEVVSDEFTEFG